MRPTYLALFQLGQQRLNAGRIRQALETHLEVEHQSGQTAETRQQCGICYRMLGMSMQANKAFEQAMTLAEGNPIRQGTIMRDWAMVPALMGTHDLALKRLDSSSKLLRKVARGEYFMTMGFIGRVHLLQGDLARADGFMHMADVGMRGDVPDVYLLNNAVWWLKAIRNPMKRLRIARRVFPIARETKNYGRMAQLVLLVVFRSIAI